MTSPSGPSNFEYNDDSVVARLSFDVPPQALTDVTQLTQALSAMATQQEYIARSTGTWLDYMQQVPQIMERANQSYREAITQMERMSYIQGEMGGGPGPNVSPGATAGPQGGGYTTAAPAGYNNPFAGQFFGMGMTPDLMGAHQQLGMMASQDPRLYANMMAARGQAVNPAMMGAVGGAVAGATGQGGVGNTGGGQGWGNAAPGSQSSQATQSARDSASPPDPTQSGQGKSSEQQNIPATPHPDSPAWQQAIAGGINSAQQVVNEAQASGGRGSKLLGMASAGLGGATALMNKAGSGGGMGQLGNVAKGVGAAGALGGAAWLFNKGQDVGEMATRYAQLGSIQGGDAGQGVEMEAKARMLALNPFITTQQARQVMQMAMSEGFRGGDYDTAQDFMIKNFKDMGLSFSQSMDLVNTSVVKSGESTQSFHHNMEDLQKTMDTMKILSKDGGAALPDRMKQLAETTDTLGKLNVPQDMSLKAATGLQQMFPNDKVLRDALPGMADKAFQNPLFMTQVANAHGINNLLPGAIPGALADAGIQLDDAFMEQARRVAGMVKGMPGGVRGQAEAFRTIMAQQGIDMDVNEAFRLYSQLVGNPNIERDSQASQTQAEAQRRLDMKGSLGGNVLKGASNSFSDALAPGMGAFNVLNNLRKGDSEAAWGDVKKLPGELAGAMPGASLVKAGIGSIFGDSAQEAAQKQLDEARGNSGGNGTVKTEGNVTGQLTVTIDQSGKATAPSTIQLSGQQKSANAGYGSAQMNNAGPGDSTFGPGWNK